MVKQGNKYYSIPTKTGLNLSTIFTRHSVHCFPNTICTIGGRSYD